MAKFESKNGKLYIDGKEVLVGFESYGGYYWFGVEKVQVQTSVIDGKEYPGDQIWFGLVQAQEEEWGDFSETEIKLLGPMRAWKLSAKALPYSGRRN